MCVLVSCLRLPCSVSAELASLQSRLGQAERLAKLEVELAAREAEARLKVGGVTCRLRCDCGLDTHALCLLRWLTAHVI